MTAVLLSRAMPSCRPRNRTMYIKMSGFKDGQRKDYSAMVKCLGAVKCADVGSVNRSVSESDRVKGSGHTVAERQSVHLHAHPNPAIGNNQANDLTAVSK